MIDKTTIQDGDKISALTAIENLKTPLFNLIKTYPTHISYGILETYFKGELGKKVVKILNEDGIIKRIPIKEVKEFIKKMTPEDIKKLPEGEERFIWYRFTPRGIEFIISLINFDNNQKTEKYTKEMRYFTRLIIWLTWLLVILGSMTIIIGILSIIN
jgi:hypothetical protein